MRGCPLKAIYVPEHIANSFIGAAYYIAANGSFTYKMSGVISNRSANDEDSGTVELGAEFVTFRGHAHVVRYRFLNLQQAIDITTYNPHPK
jgi:hypothetical protein